MQNEPEEHRIFVGGLDRDLEEDEFVEAFGRYGELVTWDLTSRRGFGFVSYHRKRDAESAIADMDGMFLGHQRMRVEWAFGWPRADTPEQKTTDDYESVFNMTSSNNRSIHCKGLARDITKETLENIFSQFGIIEEIDLYNDYSDYAFIHFNSKEAAALAICSINDTEIDGSRVRCNWSHRPDFHSNRLMASYRQTTSDESSSDSSHSSSSSVEFGDEFDRIFNETTPNNRTVYCGGLVSSVTNEIIEEIFSPFGIIENITLFVDRTDYGFIRFNTKEAATLAICSINGTCINGFPVKCSWSHRADDFPEPQSSESSPESSVISTSDQFSRLHTRVGLVICGGAAASAPLTEDESQGAAKPKEKKTDLLCKICMDEELGIVFLPCGHLTSCAKCARQINACPLCRRRITGKVRTYLS